MLMFMSVTAQKKKKIKVGMILFFYRPISSENPFDWVLYVRSSLRR